MRNGKLTRRDDWLECPDCGGTLKQWPSDNPCFPQDYFECPCGYSCASGVNPTTGALFPIHSNGEITCKTK